MVTRADTDTALALPPAPAEWPTSPAPVLGREHDISDLTEALEFSPLITLTGAPGIGKTSLARAVANLRSGGAAVVELAPVTDPAEVLKTVAGVLRVPEMPASDLVQAVAATLSRRRLLLVLDNCEHLLRPTARVVEELLAAGRDLRVLASSREPLGLKGEREWPVSPLPVPPADTTPDPETLLGYPAVALFVERAKEAQPGFELSSFFAPDVAEICRHMDGVPLAIELAAARVAALTPSEIVQRLSDRLDLLSNRGRSSVSRHRTLTAALDSSYALLTAPERTLLRRLSAFADRFELDAATGVCSGEQVDPPGVEALMKRLVSKSLVVFEPAGRYRLLETVRVYAATKLDQAGEGAEIRTAHARYYMNLAERADPELAGPNQQRWLERLDYARADVRAAVEWSLCSGEPETALRLTTALVLFWRVRGHYTEGRDQLATALAAGEGQPLLLCARARWGVGFLTDMAGDPTAAIAPLEQSLADARRAGDARCEARALLILANVKQHFHDRKVLALLDDSIRLARQADDAWCLAHALAVAGFECSRLYELRRGRRMLEESVSVSREAGDLQGLRFGLLGLGEVAISQGDYREAQSRLEEAVEVTRLSGDDYDRVTALGLLGELALDRGEYSRATELVEEALELLPDVAPSDARPICLVALGQALHAQGERESARQLFDQVASGAYGTRLLLTRAELASDEGDSDTARRMFGEALETARSEGNQGHVASALHGLGHLARATGDPDLAAALYDEALTIRHRIGEVPRIADSLEAVAGLSAHAGHPRRAARLFGAAAALRDRIGKARAPWHAARYECDIALIATSLGDEESRAALAEGRVLSVAEAVAAAGEAPLRTRPTDAWDTLTKREQEIGELVAQGLTNPEIADHLGIARETVKTHLANIFAKLGINKRWKLAREVRYRVGGSKTN